MRTGEIDVDAACPSEDALAAFVDGAAAPADRDALLAHVAACSRCAATLAAFARDFDATEAGAAEPRTGTPTLLADERAGEPVRARASDGRYVFGAAFAAGGLGVVRRAEDRRLRRPVAVKELLTPSPAAERRFLREAAITARLQHPAIVPIYDIGRHPGGEPFYCMKLVEGQTLAAAIRGASGLLARVGLLEHVIAAADAIAYAHRHGVVHRDLKPANILIGEVGETVVIDWGLAKDLDGELDDALEDTGAGTHPELAPLTQAGAVMGTLRYMPPEQALGGEVDPRSDVFSLGAVLFHVLAGEAPYAGAQGPALLARVSEGAAGDLRERAPDAPAELVAIAEKAMAPDPGRRYASAGDFAEDLRRFRTGRLVGAHHYSAGDVLRRWLRRHRALIGLAAASLLVLGVVGLIAVQNIRRERDVAEDASALAAAEAARAREAGVEAGRQRGVAREHLVAAQTARAADAVELGAADEALLAAASALAIREDPIARGALVAGASSIIGPNLWSAPLVDRPHELTWHPSAGILVLETDRVERWSPTGEARAPLTGGGFAFAISPSPDGRRIALDSAGTLAIYEPDRKLDGPTSQLRDGWTGAYGLVWRDADHLIASDGALWELSTGRRRDGWPRRARVRAIAGTPDGRVVVTGGHSHTVDAWDAHSFADIGPLEQAGVGAFSVAITADGARVAAGGEVRGGDGKIRIWELPGGRLVETFRAHRGEVHFVGFSPDGRWLASSGSDETLRIWHVPSFTEVASLRRPGGKTPRFAFAPDSAAIAVAFAEERRLRIYSLQSPPGGLEPHYFPRPIERVAWSPDGRRLAAAREDGRVHVFDTHARTESVIGGAADDTFLGGQVLAWTSTERLLVARGDHELVLADPTSGSIAPFASTPHPPYQLTPLAGGRLLVAASTSLLSLDLGGAAPSIACPEVRIGALAEALGAWTPDRSAALLLQSDGRLRRVPLDGSPCTTTGPEGLSVEALQFTPDGASVAVATSEEILILDYPSWQVRARLARERSTVSALRFDADARYLFAADWSGRISVWRLADGALYARWRGHQNRIWTMELAPDQRRLATGSADRTLRTWDLATLDLARADVPEWVEARTGVPLPRSAE